MIWLALFVALVIVKLEKLNREERNSSQQNSPKIKFMI